MELKIKINRAQCRICGSVIESTDRHDFKTCKCGEISVDGGHDYIRRGWQTDRTNIIELSVTNESYQLPEDAIRLFPECLEA